MTKEEKPENDQPTKQDAVKDEASDKESSGALRLYPNIKWIIVWIIMIGSTVFMHYAASDIEDRVPFLDQAVRNALTFLAILGIPFTFVLWFSFFSDNGTRRVRMSAFFGYLGFEAVVIFVMLTCVDYDGDLTPIGWHWPGQKAADYELDAPPTDNQTVDLKTATPEDFPQFLGPNRDGKLPNTYFAYDWEKEKPKMLWKKPIGPGHSGFSTRNGYAVTMEQRGDTELTTCYEIESGDLMWSYGVETRHDTWLGKLGPRSTPTIFDGFVYSLGAHGHLACLDGSNGSPVWTKDLLKEFNTSVEQEKNAVKWGRSASPLVFGDRVVVPAGGPKEGPHVSLVCYNRKTGEEIWRGGDTQISYASPIQMTTTRVGGGYASVIVSVNESNVTAHRIDDGEVLWTVDRPGDSTANASTSQPVVLPGINLLLTKGYGAGSKRIQYQGGVISELWENTAALKTKFTNAVFDQAYAYALSDGRLECIDLRNGKRVWKSRKSYGHGQLLLCGSELLILSEKGYVALVRAWGSTEEQDQNRGHVQFTSFQAIEGTSWNTIAVHGNKLLVRNSKEAACYEMPIRYKD